MRTAPRFVAPLLGVLYLSLSAALPARAADDDLKRELGELHVVCLYEGVEKTGDQIHGPRAVVTVDRPRTSVTLVLVSYESITWDVKVTPETNLEKVILGGYYKQALKNKPDKTVVVEAWRDEGRRKGLAYGGYKIDSVRFRGLVHELASFTKLPISSYYGTYRYKHEEPIAVNRIQDDPRLSADYPKPTPLAELPELIFPGVHVVSDGRGFDSKSSLGDFTLAGLKAETLKPLPAGVSRLAYDAKGKKYYGITRHGVVEVDLVNQKATKMDLGLDVPRLSWVADVGFDWKRGRLLVLSSHVRGYLYAYDTAAGTWSVLAENPGVQTIAYHPKHDVIYGLGFPHGEDGSVPVLRQFNADGALILETALGDPIFPGALGGGPGNMSLPRTVAVDEYLVVIGSPGGFGSESPLPPIEYIYLLEPKTGKTWLTAKTAKSKSVGRE